jgi:putative heme-binding domain-containing protein
MVRASDRPHPSPGKTLFEAADLAQHPRNTRMNFRPFLASLAAVVSASSLLAAPQIDFQKHERIAFVGGSQAERMSLFGHFEALLHERFADRELVVYGPEVFVCFFGFNESYAGAEAITKFTADYEKYVADMGQKYGRGGKARFVLVSPTAFEDTADPLLPAAAPINERLAAYTEAIRALAARLNLPFVDVFAPTKALFAAQPGMQFTINGAHLNEAGDREMALLIDRALFDSANPADLASKPFGQLRAAINDKSWVHQQDYRMLNGWYVYGGRRTWDTETFPLEYKKIRAMAAVRDRYVWDIAQERSVPPTPDDSQTGELIVPKTRFGTPSQSYSEPKELRYLGGQEAISQMTPAPGFEVTLFADETRFPELAKPVQLTFDNRGRLWVSTMPSYPQWRPGDPKPKDKLLIFEDTDGDGRADKCTTFHDQLHCPVGFELVNGGVLVMNQPRMVFLKDTDGDDRADQVTHHLDGWASDDTHHTMGAFEWSHGGLLHGLEGVAMSTTLETPWGPFRNANTPGAYVVDPRSWKVRHFITPGYGNPWCYVFNEWGQGIAGDGTTAQQHWDSPLSGEQKGQRKGLNPIFNNEGMRPVIGSEFLLSRHLPDEVQGQFIYACVINMNGLTRFEIRDDKSGYGGKRVADLLKSSDKNFRPADPQIGPDGAVWFGDWHNPLIGHMQYSQRDPNRDHVRGRIYRLTATGRPLNKPVLQFGKSEAELVRQLEEYEPRTRYRARRELRDRPKPAVYAALKAWLAGLDPAGKTYDRVRLEALYVQQGHRDVDRPFLAEMLKAATGEARASAVRILSDESARIADPLALLRPMVADPHPRVRLEAVRALSFFGTQEAAELAVKIAAQPVDYHLDYTLQHTLWALESEWKPAFEKGEFARGDEAGRDFVTRFVKGQPSLGVAAENLRKLIENEGVSDKAREGLIKEIARVEGRPREGRFVLERVCTSCHRIQNFGISYGPELTQVGGRLKREQIITSILYPNREVAPQWLTTNISTKDGQELSGVVGAEDDQFVTLKIGGDKVERIAKSNIATRDTLKVSNMPEGLAASLSPQEFFDLIEYLSSLK